MAFYLRSTKLSAIYMSLLFSFAYLFANGQAPTHTRKFDFIDQNINGFWEYLPRDYNTDTSLHPLLIFMHGSGETGTDQSNATLDRLLIAGVPRLIDSGIFPDSFTVANKSYRFIVLSPQIKNGLEVVGTVGTSIIQPSTIDAVIEYAKTTYKGRIDESRIYLAGLSMGGGAIWDYAGSSSTAAKKIAAIVVAAGAADLSAEEANIIAAADLPILATHNNVDDIVLANRTRTNITTILSFSPTITPAPLAFYWDSPGNGFDGRHNVWGRTFEDLQPNSTPGGNLVDVLNMSAYEWMLQFARTSTLPVTWEKVSAKESNGTVVVEWSVSAEVNVKQYEVEKSVDGSHWKLVNITNPAAGSAPAKSYRYTDLTPFEPYSFYRIKQVDLDGKFTYSTVKQVEVKRAVNRFKVFPNPFIDKLDIQARGVRGGKLTVSLLSSSATVLRQESKTITTADFKITFNNLQSLSKGMYYVVIKDEHGNLLYSGKVAKNNP